MNKTGNIFCKMCLCLAFVLTGIIFLLSFLRIEGVNVRYQSILHSFLYHIQVPAMFLLLLIVILIVYKIFYKKLSNTCFTLVMLGIMVLAQISFLFFISHPMFTTDTAKVHNEALAMLYKQDGMIDLNNQYFSRYTNNYFFTVIFYYFYSFLYKFGITDYWIPSVILNLFCLDLGVIFGYLSIKIIGNIRTANLFLILCIFCPTTYVWLTFVYTNTISIPFVMAILYVFLLLQDYHARKIQILLSVILGSCICIGYMIRPTTIIPAIAICIYALIKQKKKYIQHDGGCTYGSLTKSYIIGVNFIIVCSVCVIGFFSINTMTNKHVPNGYENKNFPITHWIMMGLNTNSNGGYIATDVAYTEKFSTKNEKKEANVNKIKKRLSKMGVTGYTKLVIKKMGRVWAFGSDESFSKAGFATDYPVLYEDVMGSRGVFFRIYTQGFRTATFFCICICIFMQMRRKKISDMFLYSLTLLGSILFFILWEANYKYNICFMYICLLLMSDGIHVIDSVLYCYKKKNIVKTFFCFLCIMSLLSLCVGKKILKITGDSLEKVYRTEKINDKSINKDLLKNVSCVRQSFRIKQDKHKYSIVVPFYINATSDEKSFYKIEFFSMPSKTVLHKETITQSNLDKQDRYAISFIPKLVDGDSFYILELKQNDGNSMYPCVQGWRYLDMYPYGELTIDGKTSKGDLFFEIYRES